MAPVHSFFGQNIFPIYCVHNKGHIIIIGHHRRAAPHRRAVAPSNLFQGFYLLLELTVYIPWMVAQYQSGIACSNRFPCGMGSLKCTICLEVCTHKMGVILADYHVKHLFYQNIEKCV